MDELLVAEVLGTIAFALSGFYVAVKERLDLLGVFIASFLTALGGGIVRDTIADRAPYTFTHLSPTLLVVIVLVLSIALKLHHKDEIEKKFYFIISDTLGLVSFAISGALVGLQAEFNFFGVILLALLTAVGGGVMRDILLNRVKRAKRMTPKKLNSACNPTKAPEIANETRPRVSEMIK